MSAPDDILKIAHVPGLEPEEQPLVRESVVSVDVRGSKDGQTLGQMGSRVESHTTAGEFAMGLRRICANCKNFDQAKAQQLFTEKALTQDGQIELKNLKTNLLQLAGGNISMAGEYESLSEFLDLGYCHAFSKIDNEVIVHPFSNCPTQDWGDQFVAIDKAARVRGEKAADQILRIAEGKTNV